MFTKYNNFAKATETAIMREQRKRTREVYWLLSSLSTKMIWCVRNWRFIFKQIRRNRLNHFFSLPRLAQLYRTDIIARSSLSICDIHWPLHCDINSPENLHGNYHHRSEKESIAATTKSLAGQEKGLREKRVRGYTAYMLPGMALVKSSK